MFEPLASHRYIPLYLPQVGGFCIRIFTHRLELFYPYADLYGSE
jgi:hypothetical protein